MNGKSGSSLLPSNTVSNAMSCSDNLRKEKFSLTQFTAGASSFCMFYHRFQLKISHTLLLIWTISWQCKTFSGMHYLPVNRSCYFRKLVLTVVFRKGYASFLFLICRIKKIQESTSWKFIVSMLNL